MTSSTSFFSFQKKDLSRFLFDLYEHEPRLLRKLISARPFVCPFDRLEQYVLPNAKILDVGCGNGMFLSILLAAGRISEGIGCDIHAGALVAAKAAAQRARQGSDVSFQQITGFDDLPSARFDVVVMVDVLHHVPEDERAFAIEKALNCVGPGGIFLFKDMVEKPFLRRLAHNIDDLIFSGEWVKQVKTAEVEAQVRSAGFDLIKSEDIPRVFYGNTLRVFRRQS